MKLCKKRGFIFPSAELYNSMSGFFDYGPLGVEMKNNIKQLWWREMVQQREVGTIAGGDTLITSDHLFLINISGYSRP